MFKGGRELGSRGKLGGILQLDADWSMVLAVIRVEVSHTLGLMGTRNGSGGVSLAGFIRQEEGKEERKVQGGVGPEVN